MDNNEIRAAETAVQNMLGYYITALVNAGTKDPKQYMATRLSSMIGLSAEQLMFLKSYLNSGASSKDGITLVCNLLDRIHKDSLNSTDRQSFETARSLLDKINDSFDEALETFDIRRKEDDAGDSGRENGEDE